MLQLFHNIFKRMIHSLAFCFMTECLLFHNLVAPPLGFDLLLVFDREIIICTQHPTSLPPSKCSGNEWIIYEHISFYRAIPLLACQTARNIKNKAFSCHLGWLITCPLVFQYITSWLDAVSSKCLH